MGGINLKLVWHYLSSWTKLNFLKSQHYFSPTGVRSTLRGCSLWNGHLGFTTLPQMTPVLHGSRPGYCPLESKQHRFCTHVVPPGANAIKLLQACSYKSVNIFSVTCSHKYGLNPFVDACFHYSIPNTSAVKHKQLEFENTSGYKWCSK